MLVFESMFLCLNFVCYVTLRSKDHVEERDGNSDLGSVKIIKMSPRNRALFNKYNMQSECEWSVAI